MKKWIFILLSLCLLCSMTACSNKTETKETKKATTKKETKERKIEEVKACTFPDGVKPEEYGIELMKKGTATDTPEDLAKKYKFFSGKEFNLLNRFALGLQDISICCSVEKVTGCYLNYLTGKKWTTAEEFKTLWTAAIKNMPKDLYTIMNDKDIPIDTKLKKANKYGYLAYPIIDDIYLNTYHNVNSTLFNNYKITYVFTEEEDPFFTSFYESYDLEESDKEAIRGYLSHFFKMNPVY